MGIGPGIEGTRLGASLSESCTDGSVWLVRGQVKVYIPLSDKFNILYLLLVFKSGHVLVLYFLFRLKRDISERGRELRGVLKLYNSFVKPVS